VEVGADCIELDICITSDDALVLRHDLTLPSGQPLATLTLRELRRREPGILTLDDGIDLIGGRSPLLLDIKTELAVAALARRLMAGSGTGISVCTENTSALTEMRTRAPRVGRWLSLPDMGAGSYQGMRSVVSGLLKHRYRGGLGDLGRELGGALKDARSSPAVGLVRIGGAPWRAYLPSQVRRLAGEVGACALSLHHWVVTPQICEAAHLEGLPVAAWTVNRAEAAVRLAECGVDFITTDAVAAMRLAVSATTPP